jgi:hypothetical protein
MNSWTHPVSAVQTLENAAQYLVDSRGLTDASFPPDLEQADYADALAVELLTQLANDVRDEVQP